MGRIEVGIWVGLRWNLGRIEVRLVGAIGSCKCISVKRLTSHIRFRSYIFAKGYTNWLRKNNFSISIGITKLAYLIITAGENVRI